MRLALPATPHVFESQASSTDTQLPLKLQGPLEHARGLLSGLAAGREQNKAEREQEQSQRGCRVRERRSAMQSSSRLHDAPLRLCPKLLTPGIALLLVTGVARDDGGLRSGAAADAAGAVAHLPLSRRSARRRLQVKGDHPFDAVVPRRLLAEVPARDGARALAHVDVGPRLAGPGAVAVLPRDERIVGRQAWARAFAVDVPGVVVNCAQTSESADRPRTRQRKITHGEKMATTKK